MASCSSDIVMKQNKIFNNKIWFVNDSLNLKLSKKSLDENSYKLCVKIKHTNAFSTNNLWLFLNKYCDGATVKDTVNCVMSDKYGKWLGNQTGDCFERTFVLQDSINLNKNSRYTLIHGMRELKLKGIKSISLLIEKNKK